jgi:hypothetical protein
MSKQYIDWNAITITVLATLIVFWVLEWLSPGMFAVCGLSAWAIVLVFEYLLSCKRK